MGDLKQEALLMARKSFIASRGANTLIRPSLGERKDRYTAIRARNERQRSKQLKRPAHQKVCWIPKEIRHVASVMRTDVRGKQRKVPSITLRGDWLRAAGFAPESPVLIRVVVRGQVVIDRLCLGRGSRR